MNKKSKIIAVSVSAVLLATVAIAEAYERLSGTVLIGQHSAVPESITFDQDWSPNAAIAVDTSGNLTMSSGNTGNILLSPDGTLALSLSSAAVSPQFRTLGPVGSASAPTYSFTGDIQTGIYRSASSTMTFASGGSNIMQVGSNVQINNTSTGGNVPHNCGVIWTPGTSGFSACPAGSIATGGGCDTSGGAIGQSCPAASSSSCVITSGNNAVGWLCSTFGGTQAGAWAVCCAY
jgi:hypothetical protein